jgi:hypothetical protein
VFGLARALRRRGAAGPATLDALLALCAGAALAYVCNTIPLGVEHGIRQSTFALIAGVPAAVLAAGSLVPSAALYMGAAVPLVLALLFAPALGQRIFYAARLHTIAGLSPEFFRSVGRAMKAGLSPVGAQWMRAAQASIPPGAPMMVFGTHPHHLDFARNPVYVAMKLGIAAFGPELNSGTGLAPARTAEMLQKHGVRYVVWQTRGLMFWDDFVAWHLRSTIPGDARIARHMNGFLRSLERLAASHPVIHDEEGLIVIDLGPPGPAR